MPRVRRGPREPLRGMPLTPGSVYASPPYYVNGGNNRAQNLGKAVELDRNTSRP